MERITKRMADDYSVWKNCKGKYILIKFKNGKNITVGIKITDVGLNKLKEIIIQSEHLFAVNTTEKVRHESGIIVKKLNYTNFRFYLIDTIEELQTHATIAKL